uniref:Uncharacterized protein n=1 Tax=viral metagenome TaxID=1070528 RepID=A0A6C0B0E0_9ZZZZ
MANNIRLGVLQYGVKTKSPYLISNAVMIFLSQKEAKQFWKIWFLSVRDVIYL